VRLTTLIDIIGLLRYLIYNATETASKVMWPPEVSTVMHFWVTILTWGWTFLYPVVFFLSLYLNLVFSRFYSVFCC